MRVRPFCTSRFCTSTVSDGVGILDVASRLTNSARPSAAFSTNSFTCADARSLPFNRSASLPSLTSALPHVKGKLKAFAITTKSRSALAPDIPTMDEAGVRGYEMSIWNGMVVPTGTPNAIVNRLHETIVQILKSPQAQERYANVGADIRYSSPEEFQALIRAEIAKWAKVIKAAGIRVDQ